MIEHITPSLRACRGSIYAPEAHLPARSFDLEALDRLACLAGGQACRGSIYRTRNDGRHKCRPYKDLKRKFLYYQGKAFAMDLTNDLMWARPPLFFP